MKEDVLIFISILMICLLGISGIILAEEFNEGIKLCEGKNTINLSFEFNPIYVSDLIQLNPEIETVTRNNGTQEIGYVNIFGGIGKNFVIQPNKTYEITTKQEINLNLR